MGLKKCPRCELNYIKDDEQFCNVCKRHMKGEVEADEAVAICIECGENPAVRGSDLCAVCLREARRQETLEKMANSLPNSDPADVDGMNDIDELEVPIDDDDDIPEIELEEIDKELGSDEDVDDDLEDDEEEDGEQGRE